MGCFICKQMRTEYYKQEAGDCWVCMSINLGFAAAITLGLAVLPVPTPLVVAVAMGMAFRVGHVGYLFPNTPQWLPYIDFLLEPLGTTPDEGEALKELSGPVTGVCTDAYDEEAAQQDCIADLTDVIALRYRQELTEAEFIGAVSEITGESLETMLAASEAHADEE